MSDDPFEEFEETSHSDLVREIVELRAQIDSLQEELEDARDEADFANTELSSIEFGIWEAEDREAELLAEIQGLQAEIADLTRFTEEGNDG